MLSIPSVGSVVSGVLINRDATKAKITFDDGCSILVGMNNKGIVTKAPVKESKKLSKKTIKESKKLKVSKPKIKTRLTSSARSVVENMTPPSENSYKNALSRAKNRANRFGESTIDASEKMALGMSDGAEIDLGKLT